MYLSRVAIDVKKYESMRALSNLERLHGMVESSFAGGRQRNLWRLDRLDGTDYLLMLSPIPPQNNNLPDQIGLDGSAWETKAYNSLLTRIIPGSKWHFRLTANPTVSVLKNGKKRGKVKAITIAHKQREWLMRQAAKKGFMLRNTDFDIIQSEWKTIKKGGKEIQILAVSFEGLLTVSDADAFCLSLVTGIGKEKAFGMGLLTVVPYG